MKIDLHTHTTFSDGTMSPTELVQHAIINGVTILGLSDHDTVAGWDEAISAIRGDFQLVLGSEISCFTREHKSVHMLGLLLIKVINHFKMCWKPAAMIEFPA